jgi:hypothetical protein
MNRGTMTFDASLVGFSKSVMDLKKNAALWRILSDFQFLLEEKKTEKRIDKTKRNQPYMWC